MTLLEESETLDPAERREFSRIIVDQANHMRGLISDLLDAGRIGAGTLTVAPEPSEVSELVEPARSAFLSGGGRHAIFVDLPPGLPRVMAEGRRIAQVLGNLLAKTAPHSPEASPIQRLRRTGWRARSDLGDRPGAGRAPERLPNLFSNYGGERATTGTGLGLVICKGLVEAHGGRIHAESGGPEESARFTFTVPVAGDAAPDPFPPGPAQSVPARVLVVDDDPLTLRYVREALTGAGYAALVAGDPAELSRIIRGERPDLVPLDLVLTGTDGIALMGSVPELADPEVEPDLCSACACPAADHPSNWPIQ